MDVLIDKGRKPGNFSVQPKWLFWRSDPLARFCVVTNPTWCGPGIFSVQLTAGLF